MNLELPQIQPTAKQPPKPRSKWRGFVVHAGRIAMVAAIVWLIRDQHVRYQSEQAGRDAAEVSAQQLQSFFPAAASISGWDVDRGERHVYDADGKELGYFVQTSPDSDKIVGYSGPTNVLIAFSPDDRVLGMQVLSSRDTREHVADVLKDKRFLQAFNGLSWEEAGRKTNVDAVSGATLTSLAIIESVTNRLGGEKPSLKFPEPITLDEVRPFFPGAAKLQPRDDRPALLAVLDEQGKSLGSVFRTSPAADAVMGYQGPTDTLVALGPDDKSIGVALRKSYDNQPYVGYAGGDPSYLALFEGLTLDELSRLDPKAEEIEGVSGATMTSMAMAYGIPKGAEGAQLPPSEKPERRLVIALRDYGTVAVVALSLVMAFTRLRGNRWSRIGFQLLLVFYLGFLNGDILSQALLVGWSQSGIPWRLAPGLVLLTAAALLVPVVTKKQLYCHHICPFGAAQQLIKGRLRWQWHPPGWLSRSLALVPLALLGLVVFVGMTHADVNLAGIEPFDAFVFWIAGAATLFVAAVGLVFAAITPMAYCRFGCPTGMMLGYLRFHGQSERFNRRDVGALLLLTLAIALRFM
jgi:NosR/NirI family transcriptional regulator, nitrous oxide reductase regulator